MGVKYQPLDFSKHNKRPISTFEPLFNFPNISNRYTATTSIVTAAVTDSPEVEEPVAKTTPAPAITITTAPVAVSNKDEFIATVTPFYEKALKEHGYDPAFAKLLVAQDGLETGWKIDPTHYNLGNITAGSSWKGRIKTRGDKDAAGKRISQSFRVYDSLEQYVNDKIGLLASSRYDVFSGTPTADSFTSRLKGYAADPNYSNKIRRVIASMQVGGKIKENLDTKKKVWDAINYMHEWNKSRAKLLQENGEELYGIPIPSGLLANAHKYSMKTASLEVDPTMENDGEYHERGHKVKLKDLSQDTIIHELTHAEHPEAQVAKVQSIIDSMDGDILADGVDRTAYNMDPNEVYAKFRTWAYQNNLDPSKPLSANQIWDISNAKKKNFTITTRTIDPYGNYGFVTTTLDADNKVIHATPLPAGHKLLPETSQFTSTPVEGDMDFDTIYKPEFILKIANLVAENKVVKDADVLRAKLGLKLK